MRWPFRRYHPRQPSVDFFPTAVIARRRNLRLAPFETRRTFDAHMKMVVMPIVRPHFAKPFSIRSSGLAQGLLDRRMHENALDLRIGCRALDQRHLLVCEDFRIDGE